MAEERSRWAAVTEQELGPILVEHDYLSKEDYQRVLVLAKRQRATVSEVIISQNLMSKELIGQAIAEYLKVPYADLQTHPPTLEMVRKLSEDFAVQNHAVIYKIEGNTVTVASDQPANSQFAALAEQNRGQANIQLAYAPTEEIVALFQHYRKSLETRFSKIVEAGEKIAPEIIEEIFADALSLRASDIHLEPGETEVMVRFRIDGILHEAGRLPKQYYEGMVNRIKVQASIRTDKHFEPQDGTIRWKSGDEVIDVRVSIVPLLTGEKIAMRVLSSYVNQFSLGDLRLTEQHQLLLEQAAKKPFGMILVVGPTGSGKTTTLYAVVKLLNQPEVNITTIEDPVEYKMEGVNQIQVNEETDLTFAHGLRSIVRQDPDIILVGEIRDHETAEIAVNAALTGHLLLSTFHANDAATAIPRLLDMEVQPFLLSSTMELIIAQRLVREICPNCRYSAPASQADILKIFPRGAKFFPDETTTLYHGKGCSVCSQTGYQGRIAIYEFIGLSDKMRSLILEHPSTDQIWQLAREEGSVTLFEDGILKVLSGVTTLEEVLRVAELPSWLETLATPVPIVERPEVAKLTTEQIKPALSQLRSEAGTEGEPSEVAGPLEPTDEQAVSTEPAVPNKVD